MSRFSRYDTDEERLPEGMTRVGYDADTQVYTFRDADGSYWESAPGNQYGRLTRVGDADPEIEDTEPFLGFDTPSNKHHQQLSWRSEMRPFLNFGVLIGLCLILLFWFLHWGAKSDDGTLVTCPEGTASYVIENGDTCWAIADKNGLKVDDILGNNAGLNCDALGVGETICLPSKQGDEGKEEAKEEANA